MTKKPKMVLTDFSQLEARILANQNEIDPSLNTGRFVTGPGQIAVTLPEGDTPELRAARKALSHMEQYGMTVKPRGKK